MIETPQIVLALVSGGISSICTVVALKVDIKWMKEKLDYHGEWLLELERRTK
ncbi:hypothetical protein HGP28_10735 [Vibrio sp. SM6]|uniref:Uncharacterized protein n=1 Tax=Vibrio agarilyticus TaxID=2726741 RepID=A0A7X8TR82_9VIBR|nr:hypothetical protein [Vibrio agarilyticus]NLS13368.1 hypothetical protein [Vibrio agarilyticus]